MTTHKLEFMRGSVGAGLALGILLAVTPLAAQTTTNPRSIEFTASPDHNETLPDGRAAVSRYDLRFFNQGASQPFQTNSLGKPAPGAAG